MLVGDDHRRLGYDEYELYKYRLDSPDTNRNPDTNRLSGTIPSELGLLTKLSESLLCVCPPCASASFLSRLGYAPASLYVAWVVGNAPPCHPHICASLACTRLNGNTLSGTIPTQMGSFTLLKELCALLRHTMPTSQPTSVVLLASYGFSLRFSGSHLVTPHESLRPIGLAGVCALCQH